MPESMITDRLSVEVCTVDNAPRNYKKDKIELLRIEKAIIVEKGTMEGNATVDLQMCDQKGNKFVVLATGNILKSLAKMIEGVEQR